jgi:hypothetical protein
LYQRRCVWLNRRHALEGATGLESREIDEHRADGQSATRASVTVGPFAVFFTNVNRAMSLPGTATSRS